MSALDNIVALQAVANGLDDLLPRVVFVGGATVGLYASSPTAPASRPTTDVDCIVELASYGDYARLEEQLRERGFRNDMESRVQVRWRYHGMQVDVMPTEARILGFSNPWYPAGIASAQQHQLPDGQIISILAPAYLLATKFCALTNRAGDLRWSSDWEDIVYVLEERPSLLTELQVAPAEVRAYVAEQCAAIAGRPNVEELLEAAMSRGGDLETLRQRLTALAALH